jgi:uncharacterized DUF497 family protein
VKAILHWDDFNRGKIAVHGVTVAEVEEVVTDDLSVPDVSRSSGRPMLRGYTQAGRYLVVVHDELDDDPLRLYPVTAFAPGD